ncbi:hypothetical protein O9G_004122 [Rozella allomycis CSF55]|uniref:Uncharacterized protein n=1 Tax=Rozella allomycis (strain CSF55) TaxID=988480 RepID=A0A075AWP3_ROZAC|nr:hypothetical protein O9G_004122 [Rozella allomycis CSF55]|eukprot:EPZ34755.1 hypothetical protein O9G_004122 [Rozella allomycis CSF55]
MLATSNHNDDIIDDDNHQNEDIEPTNYLDITRKEVNSRQPFYYRLIVVGALRTQNESKDDYNNYYEKLFPPQHTENEDSITGILLLYKEIYFHLIEATYKPIQKVLNDLNRPDHTLFTDTKVLTFLEDIGKPSFSFWAIRSLQAESEESSALSSDISELTFDNIPQHVTAITNSSPALDDLMGRYSTLVPKKETVKAFVQTSNLLSIQEYMNFMNSDDPIQFDGDVVWPVPEMIQI